MFQPQRSLPLQIAIDGPVASGKGDIASRLAKKLNLLYIYTGAMYRMLALACIQDNVSTKNEKAVLEILIKSAIDLLPPDRTSALPYKAVLDGRDVSERIMREDTAIGASDVGTIPQVRKIMVARQQEIAKGNRVVMEGRDIGYRVLPDAQLKIFLTADVEERAKRRYLQWQEKGFSATYESTLLDTQARDKQDSSRKTDPLKKTEDSWELDTTEMTQDQVVNRIVAKLEKMKLI